MKRIIPSGFDVLVERRGGSAVIVEITDVEGQRYVVPIMPDIADELGRQLLAAGLALNGALR